MTILRRKSKLGSLSSVTPRWLGNRGTMFPGNVAISRNIHPEKISIKENHPMSSFKRILLGFYLFCFDPADMDHIGPDEISSDILDFKYSM